MSNLASLLALIGYPFLVEPFLGSAEQVACGRGCSPASRVLCAAVAWLTPKVAVPVQQAAEAVSAAKSPYWLWLALSATGSVLLLAVTNHVTQNVAAIPLLWLAPLTLYLLTFIIAFESEGWYRPEILCCVLLVWLGGMGWLLVETDFQFDLWVQLGMFLSGLFVGCLFCHGELYRARPAPARLTAFYLTISAGGALGGLLVAVVAPLAFHGYYELGFGLVALALLAALRFASINAIARWGSLAVLLGVAGCAAYDGFRYQRDVLVSARNFYGVLRVKEYGIPGSERTCAAWCTA